MSTRLDFLDRLPTTQVPWFAIANPQSDGIEVCSRLRLARNLAGAVFPPRASEEIRQRVQARIFAAAREMHCGKSLEMAINSLPTLHRRVLSERRLISPEHENGEQDRGVVVALDQSWSYMVNEEDHLRIQAMRPGLALEEAMECCRSLADQLEDRLDFAYTPDLGYLTACPSNLGTGMRASVMLHLPGLVFSEQITSVMRGANQIGLVVRGLFGEGAETAGDLYQLSNQSTLGESEGRILARVERQVRHIADLERQARRLLIARCGNRLYDKVGRSYGTLRHAYGLSTRESLKHLSRVRLGLALGMFRTLQSTDVRDMMIAVLPGHLQALAGGALDGQARSVHRAGMIRQRLRGATEDVRRGYQAPLA